MGRMASDGMPYNITSTHVGSEKLSRPPQSIRVQPTTAVRVSKRGARRLYNADVPLVIVSCKLWPFGGWAPGYHIHKPSMAERATYDDDYAFDNLVKSYEWYNTSWEQGYYAAFYVNEHDALAHNVTPLRLEH